MIQIVGYLFTLFAVFDVLNVDLSQFLVGGALTGVIIGIARAAVARQLLRRASVPACSPAPTGRVTT